jgi:hypothetical protein
MKSATAPFLIAVLGILAAPATPSAPAKAITRPWSLVRLSHEQSLLPEKENSAFGSLLYDARGRLVLHDGDKTWLYTAAVLEAPTDGTRDWYGKWVSHVREFNVRNFASGDKSVALSVSGAERWAIIHDVIQVSDRLFVAFYSAFGGVRAALAERPQGPFLSVPDFELTPTEEWEKAGGAPQSLESNGAHVWIGEDSGSVVLWLGYDSYHVDIGTGQLGWAKIAIDKDKRAVRLLEKHPRNPLPLLPEGDLAARCGGNLSSDLRLAGQYVFLYYTRPTRAKSFLTVALSPDPLFQNITQRIELEPTLGDEKVIEKFESYVIDGKLHVIYESQLASGHWGTGMRTYRIAD